MSPGTFMIGTDMPSPSSHLPPSQPVSGNSDGNVPLVTPATTAQLLGDDLELLGNPLPIENVEIQQAGLRFTTPDLIDAKYLLLEGVGPEADKIAELVWSRRVVGSSRILNGARWLTGS